MNPIQTTMRKSLRKEGEKLNIFAVLDPSMVDYNLKLISTGHIFYLANNGAHQAMEKERSLKSNISSFGNDYIAPDYIQVGNNYADKVILPSYIAPDIILCSQLDHQPLCCSLAHKHHMQSIGIRNTLPHQNWVNSHQNQWKDILLHPTEHTVYLSEQAQEAWSNMPRLEHLGTEDNEYVIEETCEDFVEKWSQLLTSVADSTYVRNIGTNGPGILSTSRNNEILVPKIKG